MRPGMHLFIACPSAARAAAMTIYRFAHGHTLEVVDTGIRPNPEQVGGVCAALMSEQLAAGAHGSKATRLKGGGSSCNSNLVSAKFKKVAERVPGLSPVVAVSPRRATRRVCPADQQTPIAK